MEVTGQLHSSAFFPGKGHPLDTRMYGPRRRSGRCGAQNISCPCQESDLGRAVHSPSLYRLSYSVREPESELLYGRQFTADQFVLATSPLRLTTRILIFQLNTCGYSPNVTSSLMIGWVCRVLLGLASAVILRSESRGTHDHILLSQIRDSPNLEGQVPVFISPRSRVSLLYPQALGSLFVASYDSQGYGGGIRPRPHTGWAIPALKIYIKRKVYRYSTLHAEKYNAREISNFLGLTILLVRVSRGKERRPVAQAV
jgi:hypothetical protein